jgi:hypothetical protein
MLSQVRRRPYVPPNDLESLEKARYDGGTVRQRDLPLVFAPALS